MSVWPTPTAASTSMGGDSSDRFPGGIRAGEKAGESPHSACPCPRVTIREDFYPPHPHAEYRWAMVVDLDRCIGCGACVVACYAENNVAIVGKRAGPRRAGRCPGSGSSGISSRNDQRLVRFLPMLCQHCDEAPCESVCPVFAPHHSKEGFNNQMYNRCIGTRFCSQNCPYKVRRFNWFTFTRPEPLDWQLNPDVTVRQKGVMEKCSFCVQRIIEAKIKAKDEGTEGAGRGVHDRLRPDLPGGRSHLRKPEGPGKPGLQTDPGSPGLSGLRAAEHQAGGDLPEEDRPRSVTVSHRTE